MWLVATILDTTDIKHFHHHRKHRITESVGSRIRESLYQGTRIQQQWNNKDFGNEAEQHESRRGV